MMSPVLKDLRDVRVSAYEYAGGVPPDQGFRRCLIEQLVRIVGPISAAPKTYMGHHYLDAFAVKVLEHRKFLPYILAVAIPVNPYQRLEIPDGLSRRQVPEISRMPYDIDVLEKLPDVIGKDLVCV